MERRRLGGLEVSAVGLGCATMTPFYDAPDRDAAIDTLRHAREIGVDFLDSSDAYGQGRNEELIARAVKGHRDEYVIGSKFGNLRASDGSPTSDGRPEYVKACCERSLKRLETDVIDLYYCEMNTRVQSFPGNLVGAGFGLRTLCAERARFLVEPTDELTVNGDIAFAADGGCRRCRRRHHTCRCPAGSQFPEARADPGASGRSPRAVSPRVDQGGARGGQARLLRTALGRMSVKYTRSSLGRSGPPNRGFANCTDFRPEEGIPARNLIG